MVLSSMSLYCSIKFRSYVVIQSFYQPAHHHLFLHTYWPHRHISQQPILSLSGFPLYPCFFFVWNCFYKDMRSGSRHTLPPLFNRLLRHTASCTVYIAGFFPHINLVFHLSIQPFLTLSTSIYLSQNLTVYLLITQCKDKTLYIHIKSLYEHSCLLISSPSWKPESWPVSFRHSLE